MKKNILKIAFVAVFGIAASYNVYSSKMSMVVSDLALDNVEALANSESAGKYYITEANQESHRCVIGGYFNCNL